MTEAQVIYGREQDDPEEYPYALVLISRKVWEAKSEWFDSYADSHFVGIYDELIGKYELDPLMENILSADSEEHFQQVLRAFEADPRLKFVENIYGN